MVRDAVVGRAVVGRAVVRCAVVGRDAGNLYPNSGFYREKVEIPSHAVRESLPKQWFLPGKGIESNNIIKMKRRIAYDKNNRRN